MIYTEQDLYNILDAFKKIKAFDDSTSVKTEFHVFGNGWLGSSIYKIVDYYFGDYICYIHSDIEKFLQKTEIWFDKESLKNRNIIFINCAAKTNTIYCEAHPTEAYHVNSYLASELYKKIIAMRKESDESVFMNFIQISSGCVYDGNDHFITEEETPNPLITYSKSKLDGDRNIEELAKHDSNSGTLTTTILRPRMLFHEEFRANNLIYKVASFKKCIDEDNSMTYIIDLIIVIFKIITETIDGNILPFDIYNVVNGDAYSPYKIAKEVIFLLRGSLPSLITKDELRSFHAIDLTNTTLDNNKLKNIYDDIPSVYERMEQIMETFESNDKRMNKIFYRGN